MPTVIFHYTFFCSLGNLASVHLLTLLNTIFALCKYVRLSSLLKDHLEIIKIVIRPSCRAQIITTSTLLRLRRFLARAKAGTILKSLPHVCTSATTCQRGLLSGRKNHLGVFYNFLSISNISSLTFSHHSLF